MTRLELQTVSAKIRGMLLNVVNKLEQFESSPHYDEDYKVERQPKLNKKNFMRLELLASILEKSCREFFD